MRELFAQKRSEILATGANWANEAKPQYPCGNPQGEGWANRGENSPAKPQLPPPSMEQQQGEPIKTKPPLGEDLEIRPFSPMLRPTTTTVLCGSSPLSPNSPLSGEEAMKFTCGMQADELSPNPWLSSQKANWLHGFTWNDEVLNAYRTRYAEAVTLGMRQQQADWYAELLAWRDMANSDMRACGECQWLKPSHGRITGRCQLAGTPPLNDRLKDCNAEVFRLSRCRGFKQRGNK